jgi:DNA-3-methyladenine glycosylase
MERAIQAKVWQPRRAVSHARSLLGKHLVRRQPDGSVTAHLITEVEAYDGERDLACHAAKGRTRRTAVLYGPGGHWYVYLCYGIHEMLNLVVGPPGWPSAVLIRGVDGISGPGKLTRALGIDRRLNAVLAQPQCGLWLEDRGGSVPRRRIRATARIGVAYAGPVWAQKRWRFTLAPEAPAVRRRRPSAAGDRPGSRLRSRN